MLSVVFDTLSKLYKLGLFVKLNTCYVLCAIVESGSEELMNKIVLKEFADLITGDQQV